MRKRIKNGISEGSCINMQQTHGAAQLFQWEKVGIDIKDLIALRPVLNSCLSPVYVFASLVRFGNSH